VDEHSTVIEVMVIYEVPITKVIELPTGKSGATMEGSTGKATHMVAHATNMTAAHATHMRAESAHMTAKPATSHMAPAGEPATAAAATDWRESHNATGSNVLEVRCACYRLS
jgi:hypothetical protein